MTTNLSVAETLAQLEAKVAYHKEQSELHAAQELFHGEQKVLHEAEHRSALERFEAFKAASAAAGEILERFKPPAPAPAPPAPAPPPADIETGNWRWISRLMAAVVETKAPDEPFGASTIVREIQKRWGPNLRHRLDPRSVASTLRRWAAAGRIHQVRDGRAYHEALYTKRRKPEGT